MLDDNANIKVDNDQMKQTICDQTEQIDKFQTMEDMLLKQSELQKDEITSLRKKVKTYESGKDKEHLQDTLIQWLELFSKQYSFLLMKFIKGPERIYFIHLADNSFEA